MKPPLIEAVIQNYRLNLKVVSRKTKGLTHFDSLLQLPFEGNCLNWVIGHIIQGRSELLAILGNAPLWGQAEARVYQTGSEPITPYNADTALGFEKLLSLVGESQLPLEQALEKLTAEELDRVVEQGGESSMIGELVNGYCWHETYHVGQIELLRRLAGKADSVI